MRPKPVSLRMADRRKVVARGAGCQAGRAFACALTLLVVTGCAAADHRSTLRPAGSGSPAPPGSTLMLPSQGPDDPVPGMARRLTAADNGGTVIVRVGTRLTVDLASASGTWAPITVEGTALTLAEQHGALLPGQPLTVVLTAVQVGRGTLQSIHRPGSTLWRVSVQVRGGPLPAGAPGPS